MKVPVLAACAIAAFLLLIKVAGGQVNPNCTEFGVNISVSCCCSNNCCTEAQEGEFQHIRDNTYRVVATGQIVTRTGWSPDGRFIKCACDQIDGVWTKHPRAFVRCIYPPLPSS